MSYGNTNIKWLYYKSPLFIKSLFSSIYGYKQRFDRYGKDFREHLDFLRESQYWDLDQLKDYQTENAIKFINRNLKSIPYYVNNYSIGSINEISDIKNIPILQKSVLKQKTKQFYNTSNKKYRWSHTSGTTGSSLVFPLSNKCFQKEYAFRALHYEWGGVSLHKRERIAICAGHPVAHFDRKIKPFWVYDYVNNWIYMSSYHLSEKNLKYYIQELERFQPVMIHGYPSSIYLLAKAYKKYRKKGLCLKSIFTSSETLLNYQRKEIENSFESKVFNWYGTSEMTGNIVECESGELHLKMEHSFNEFLNDDNEDCLSGDSGRIISTNFYNSAFPLIRYDIGDSMTISRNQTSKCGRGGILIEEIQGRIEDFIVTPDGRLIGRLDHIFKDSINVIEAQIEQQNVNEIILRIVKNDLYCQQDEDKIVHEARVRLGSDIKILFEHTKEIPRSPNGKYRFIISRTIQNQSV